MCENLHVVSYSLTTSDSEQCFKGEVLRLRKVIPEFLQVTAIRRKAAVSRSLVAVKGKTRSSTCSLMRFHC